MRAGPQRCWGFRPASTGLSKWARPARQPARQVVKAAAPQDEEAAWDKISTDELTDWQQQGPPTPLLDTVNFPVHIKNFNSRQLQQLCKELRADLIHTVAKTGGHLGSSLGVVELTVALHHVFNTPDDKIIFDVGHQAYIHKMLTGRRSKMATIRTQGGLSGKQRLRTGREPSEAVLTWLPAPRAQQLTLRGALPLLPQGSPSVRSRRTTPLAPATAPRRCLRRSVWRLAGTSRAARTTALRSLGMVLSPAGWRTRL